VRVCLCLFVGEALHLQKRGQGALFCFDGEVHRNRERRVRRLPVSSSEEGKSQVGRKSSREEVKSGGSQVGSGIRKKRKSQQRERERERERDRERERGERETE